MKIRFDGFLLIGIALCFGLGQFMAPERFAMAAGLLLLVFGVRLIRAGITWTLTGR